MIKELPLDCGQNLGRQDIVVDAENRLMDFDMSGRRVLSFYPFFDESVNFFSMDYTEN